jgi:maltodextrin utilization protein YvdJ
MQTVLMLAICAIFLLVRVNYQKVATYREYLKMYVGCFVIPTVVSVLIGLIGESTAALTPVILQMGTALMMIGTIYKGSKTEIPPAKRLKDAI